MNPKNARAAPIQREDKNMLLPFLTAVELFQGISEAEARKITSLYSERRYPQGTTIFAEGDPSDAIYILRKGLVKLVSLSEKGAEMILRILKPDEVFGELLFAEETRPFTAIALKDVLVTVIPKERFSELLSSIPTVGLNFIAHTGLRVIGHKPHNRAEGVISHDPIGALGRSSVVCKAFSATALG